jgi:hypothetical protein
VSKISVVYTRPRQWAKLESDVLDLTYAPPARVLRLRNGKETTDSMGTVFDREGVENLRGLIKNKPDVFLFWTHFGEFFDRRGVLKSLRRLSPSTVFVHGSGNQVLDRKKGDWYTRRIADLLDVQTTNTTDAARIELFGKLVGSVKTLHDSAVDPSEFTPPEEEPVYDCFFGGANTACVEKPKGKFPYARQRFAFVETVAAMCDTMVRGAGWLCCNCHRVMDLAYFREMQKAKIVLGFNHLVLERYYTKRTVYGGASGRLLVTRFIPGMDEDGLEDGKNIVWFETVKEGVDKVAYYLDHDDERERIAERQREHFLERHSWEARLRTFEKIAVDAVNDKRKKKCRKRK